MTKVINALHDVLGLTEEQSIQIMQLCDTTLDGSKWDEASYSQVIRTAEHVRKAVR